MLYKIKEGVNTFDENDGLHAIPEFAKLDDPIVNKNFPEARDRRIKFVILYSDRHSPLRTLPDKQRREKAAQISGYKMEGNRLDRNGRAVVNGEVEAVETAILKYLELQFDENQDSLDSTNKLIRTNREFINHVNNRKDEEKKNRQYGKDLELANKLAKQLPELIEAKQKLESVLQVVIGNKPEITTFSSADLPDQVEGSSELSIIDQFHMNNK